MSCSVDGCRNEAAGGRRYCWGHLKRKQRGKPLSELAEATGGIRRIKKQRRRTPEEKLLEAAIEYAETPDSRFPDEYNRRKQILIRAAIAFARGKDFLKSLAPMHAGGRQRKVFKHELKEAVAHYGVKGAANMYGVATGTIYNYMRAQGGVRRVRREAAKLSMLGFM